MTAQIPIAPLPVKKKQPLRPLKWGVGLLLGAVAAWCLWQWANDMSGVRREAPKVPTIIPLPPPPPPPPEKPKEPEEVKPAEEAPPSPNEDLANPMQIDGDAQSGNDGFNIGAGKGGGMAGSGGGGLGTGTYKQYLAGTYQRLMREDPELRKKAFSIQIDLWLGADGQVTKALVAKSSGDAETDAQMLALIQAPRATQKPPASLTLPMRLSLKGRRPD
jgi:periplasmic protein TonB